ncbi:SNF-related serine/threonine-protein kinase-like isoform X2 [Culicoides brevitarsis]
MKMVQHPNVIKLYEVIDTQTKLYLVLELADGGDLYDYIMRHESGLSENTARLYFRQIVRAISYCHKLHVVHRDLKPENVVFFEQEKIVKITDFGFSNKFDPGQKLRTSCGSLAYSAPEILLGDFYDAPAVDVWSLGVILYMLVCGKPPFHEASDSETLTMIMDCKYTLPHYLSPSCQSLIKKVLIREPEKRISLEELSKSAWMQEDALFEEDLVPLVCRQNVKIEEQNDIIHQMVLGKIATKESILNALEKNEYNYITATYYLFAEQKMRKEKQKKHDKKPVALKHNVKKHRQQFYEHGALLEPPSQLELDTGGSNFKINRNRKCSIVQEEESTELSSERLSESTSQRRGSRSEGRLCSLLKPPYGITKLENYNLSKESDKQCSDTSEDETTKNSKSNLTSCSSLKYECRRDSSDSSDSQDMHKTKTSEVFSKTFKHSHINSSSNKYRNYDKKVSTDNSQKLSELQVRKDLDKNFESNKSSKNINSKIISKNKDNKIDIVQV